LLNKSEKISCSAMQVLTNQGVAGAFALPRGHARTEQPLLVSNWLSDCSSAYMPLDSKANDP